MSKGKASSLPSPESLIGIARLHGVMLIVFALQTIVYHATKVAIPEVIQERWIAAFMLSLVVTLVWYVAKNTSRSLGLVLWLLISADILFAAFCVNLTRGYASNYVVLFMLPIIVATAFRSKSSLIATSLMCALVYSGTIMNYFFQNFNEGYMSELYGEAAFYSGIFMVCGLLAWTATSKMRS